MNILQTIPGFSMSPYGTSTWVYNLLSEINQDSAKDNVDLLTPNAENPNDTLTGVGENWIKPISSGRKTLASTSRGITSFLRNSNYDLYHTIGMWKHVNHSTCAIARSKQKPYIISPDSLLYQEAHARDTWKKRMLRKLWFDRDLREAACVHAACETELRNVRALGYKGPVALIGNPVYVPNYTEDIFSVHRSKPVTTLSLAFFGELKPIKRVENLLYGVALTKRRDIEVYISGEGNTDYERFLHDETRRLGIECQVHFLSALKGFDKYAQLGLTDCLFLPSDMENFGMIIPEALIVGTPVMTSLGTPWQALNDENCGWWTDNSPESIADVISDLTSMSPDDRTAMGRRGREYILRTFAADKVAAQMLALYRWILGNADKPDFVDAGVNGLRQVL